MTTFPSEIDLVLGTEPGAVVSGFREIESNSDGTWRWAVGKSQTVGFSARARRNRIHYSLCIPLENTRVVILHRGKVCLTLRASRPNSLFQGFFELIMDSPGQQTLQIFFEREAEAGMVPGDPEISYSVRRFVFTEELLQEEIVVDRQKLREQKVVLVTIPTWSVFVPPMGAAYLASALREASIPVSVIDFNITAWHALKHLQIDGMDLWASPNARYFREEALFQSTVLPHLRSEIEGLIDQICALQPSVLGFTVYYTSLPCMEMIARACKARVPALKIVCGGPETGGANEGYRVGIVAASVMDAAVVGEGEATFMELLGRWASGYPLGGCKGVIHKLRGGTPVVEAARTPLLFQSVPIPDYGDFDLALYSDPGALPVMMSRGCVARCSFCSETRYWQKFRASTAQRAFSEIKGLVERFGVDKIYFNDSLVNGNFDALSELVDLIIGSGLKVKWNGQARIDKRMKQELLEKMARSGCEFLAYGFESGSQKVVDRMEKRSTVELAKEVIRHTHQAGIRSGLNVIVGFPGEEEEDFEMTLNFVRTNLPYIDQVGINEMNVFVGVPVGDDPGRFGIANDFQSGSAWQTVDGRNTPAVRKDRLRRILALMEESGLARGLGSSSR